MMQANENTGQNRRKRIMYCTPSLNGIYKVQSKNMADLRIELGVEEIVLGIGLAEWVLSEKSSCCWSFGCITERIVRKRSGEEERNRDTYTVKQSYIKASAAGVMFMDTSSGMGGA